MANIVTSQLLENGPRNAVYKFTMLSDGTNETNVTKVDATSSGPLGVVFQGQTFYPGIHLKIVDLWWDVKDMVARIQYHATINLDAMVLQGQGQWSFKDVRGGFGGLYVPAGTPGATGSIDITTAGAVPNGSYNLIMSLVKAIPQS